MEVQKTKDTFSVKLTSLSGDVAILYEGRDRDIADEVYEKTELSIYNRKVELSVSFPLSTKEYISEIVVPESFKKKAKVQVEKHMKKIKKSLT